MYNRWYDIEPTLSLAISLLKNAKEETRTQCAELILELAAQNNVKLKKGFLKGLKYAMMRWYDNDKMLFDAFESLKAAPDDVRKHIALEVIEFLQKAVH